MGLLSTYSKGIKFMTIRPTGNGSAGFNMPRHFVLGFAITVLLLTLSVGDLYAATEAPSNAELYQMIQELKAEQALLRAETQKAKAEAAEAKAKLELAESKLELAESKRELAAVRREQRRQPVSGGAPMAFNPGAFVRVENTFMSYGQEGGVTDLNGVPASLDDEYAPRIELGFMDSSGLGIRGRYWSYDDRGNTATGSLAVDTDYFDLELFQRWRLGADTELEGAIGLRYLDFNQEATSGATVYNLDFDGWGGTTGLQVKRKLGFGKVYGRGRYSLLWGDADITAGANTFEADDNPVHQVELALGYEMEYKFAWGNLNANLGYEWQYWTDLAMADTSFGGVGNDDVLENLSFRGWVLGIGAEF